jgi:hypothetical protein
MKASELRIGNLVNDYQFKKPLRVTIGVLEEIENGMDFYEPIPLSEEWLERFKIGFIIRNDDITNKAIRFKCFPIFYWDDGSVTIEINDFSKVKLNYVHQLQNLHFALTGQELIK